MWADPEARGLRLGAAVLASLEAGAREHGVTELRLETGEHLTAAYNLYRRFGFEHCPPWGEYVHAVHSCTMAKSIDAALLRHRSVPERPSPAALD